MKSAFMEPNLPKGHRSRFAQPKGFKETRSTVSADSPPWFKVHESISQRITPHDPNNKTTLTLFLKTTHDILNKDGSRKKGTFVCGPRGSEDTAVSEKAPEWMQIRNVPTVDTPVTSFFDPYDKNLHEATKNTTSSADLPGWAQISEVPKLPPRVSNSEKLWREDFKRPADSIRFDRDAATSKEAPDFFHIEGVPRAERNSYGGYDFDYDHGAFGSRKRTTDRGQSINPTAGDVCRRGGIKDRTVFNGAGATWALGVVASWTPLGSQTP